MDFSNRKKRILEIVRTVAMSGTGVGGSHGNNFRIGAVLVDRNSILSAKVNSLKSSPGLVPFYRYPHFHAEAAAIFAAGDRSIGSDLFVARVRRDNTLAMAKPCKGCQKLIKQYGIRNVYYSVEDGTYVKL